MTNAIHPHPFGGVESDLPHYTSFILRCRMNSEGRILARLVEVHSGLIHPVADLNTLPGLVHRLVTQTFTQELTE